MLELELRKTVSAARGGFALDMRFAAETGSVVTLFGKSGAGKTTLLRMIAGLSTPDGGRIVVKDKTWFDSTRGIHLPPQKRSVGFVFQDYALFPNMTVRQNVAYGADGDTEWTGRLLELMGLGGLDARRPHELSGGQKQRVALARALARKPKLLLLDEPLAALDPGARLQLQDEMLAVLRELSVTTVMVSHDLSEVFKMSRRVYVMENGAVTRHGTPMEVFGEHRLSGQFRFTGEVAAIEPQDIVFIVSVIVGNNIVKVMATADEVKDLRPGTRVIIVSKAFNPLIMKA